MLAELHRTQQLHPDQSQVPDKCLMTMMCSHVPYTRPRFHSPLRRRHCLNCHILAAIEASNSLTVSPVSIFILKSQLLCFRLQAFP